MPLEKRVMAAEAFWLDEESPDIKVQQMEAIVALARRLNFRTRSLQALSVDRRAKHLAQLADVGDSIATRALIAYHFRHRRALMAAFLDALQIAHEEGLIKDEAVEPPDATRIAAASAAIQASFDQTDIDLYLRTLSALDGDTWAGVEAYRQGAPPPPVVSGGV